MADSSRTKLLYAKETTWGVTPTTGFTDLRFTGESLGHQITNVTSNEVRADRQITDLIQTGATASGGVNFELSSNAYDTLLESAFYNSWIDSTPVVNQRGAVEATGNYYSVRGGAFVSNGYVVGQWVNVTGFEEPANNGLSRVLSFTNDTLVVDGAALTPESLGPLVNVSGSYLRNGTKETSFTLQKSFTDVNQNINFNGMVVNGLNLNIAAGSIITGSIEFTGKSASVVDEAVSGFMAAPSEPVMNASGNVGRLMEGGVVMDGVFIRSLSIAISNNLRGIQPVGVSGNADLGAGRCSVSGNLSVYFSNTDLYQKYLNGTATSLVFEVKGSNGKGYIFTLPKVKLSSGAVTAGGADTDVMAEFSYQALRDAATDATIQIDRFDL